MFAALATSWLFAFTAGCARKVAQGFGSFSGNFFRLTLALFLTGAVVHLLQLPTPELLGFFLSGLLGFGVGGSLMYLALPRMGSAAAMLVVQTGFVLFAFLGEWLFLGVSPSFKTTIPAFCILCGIFMNLAPRIKAQQIYGSKIQVAIAIVCAIGSAAGQAGGALVARATYISLKQAGGSINPLAATHVRLFGGWLLALIILVSVRVLLSSVKLPEIKTLKGRTSLWLFLNVLTGPILGVAFYQYALSTTSVSIVAPIVALAPIWSEVFARIFGEVHPRPFALTGALLGVAGAIALLTL